MQFVLEHQTGPKNVTTRRSSALTYVTEWNWRPAEGGSRRIFAPPARRRSTSHTSVNQHHKDP
jgi:hypothetical protein